MASDGMSSKKVDFSGVSLSITADDEVQARRLFDALAASGNIFMPISKTFWSPCFGMCRRAAGLIFFNQVGILSSFNGRKMLLLQG